MSDTAGPETAGAAAARPTASDRANRLKWRLGRWLRRHSMAVYASLFFIVLSAVLMAPSIFITVPPGHVAVMWYRFVGGTVTDEVHGEGLHVIFPWDRLYIYDARLQNTARVYDTISSNGLSMQVEIAVRYRINRETAGRLHKLVGPDYPDILVYPEIGSHARELISRYTPEQLYTETRGFIQAEILQRMVNQLGASLANQSFGGSMVTVEDVLLRSVRLPPVVSEAIERKAAQYQLMLEYDFRLAREEKERQRKRIEAEGVRDFQNIVAKTITEQYLRLRGIEATLALATSKNSKTVIVGGRDGLPLILNTGNDSPPDAADGAAEAARDVEGIGDQFDNPPNAAPNALQRTGGGRKAGAGWPNDGGAAGDVAPRAQADSRAPFAGIGAGGGTGTGGGGTADAAGTARGDAPAQPESADAPALPESADTSKAPAGAASGARR